MAAAKEKGQVEYVESGSGSDGKEGHGGEFYSGGEDGIAGYDKAYEKKLIRKVDYRLLPILGALYAISLIDRVNVCASRFPFIFPLFACSPPSLDGMERLTISSRYPTREWRAWVKILVYRLARGTLSSSLCSSYPISFLR